jgi:hemerythrin-like metal-binding protein
MQRLHLTDDLLTGLSAVDDQHRELFRWGNALLFPEQGELSRDELINGLRYLEAYVSFHFATEEQAMEQMAYPRGEAHHWQHTHFQREIRELADRVHLEGPTRALALQLHYLLYDWFVGHIRFSDEQFAAWMKQRSITTGITPVSREAMVQLGLDPELVRSVESGLFRI